MAAAESSHIPSVGSRLSHLRRTSVCLQTQLPPRLGGGGVAGRRRRSVLVGEGRGSFSLVTPLPSPAESPGEAADWHPGCQADDGSYHEDQT